FGRHPLRAAAAANSTTKKAKRRARTALPLSRSAFLFGSGGHPALKSLHQLLNYGKLHRVPAPRSYLRVTFSGCPLLEGKGRVRKNRKYQANAEGWSRFMTAPLFFTEIPGERGGLTMYRR